MVCKCAFVSSVDIACVLKRRTRSVSSWVLHIGCRDAEHVSMCTLSNEQCKIGTTKLEEEFLVPC